MSTWEQWEALGWSPADAEKLRAHATAMGIQVPVPPTPTRPGPRSFMPTSEILVAWKARPTSNPSPASATGASVPAKTVDKRNQNHITHVVFVLDASGSMEHLKRDVVKVTDAQIKHLAEQSKALDQETRVTVYIFDDEARCVIYDKDVLRMPSMEGLYEIGGMTALADATLLAIDDLRTTPEKYGDHAFLMFVITDGQENRSKAGSVSRMRSIIPSLPDHWTGAALVPNASAVHQAKQLGFPAGNIAVWDTTSAHGFEQAMKTVQTATDAFMTSRKTTGARSTKNLFTIDSSVVNTAAIRAANLTQVPYDDYNLVPVPPIPHEADPIWYGNPRNAGKSTGGTIDKFVQNINGGQYVAGQGFYELVEGKSERIQPDKLIALVDKRTRKVYFGRAARKILNLPDYEVRIKPGGTDEYLVYIQSKAANRRLIVGTHLLVFYKVPRESDYA